MPLAYIVPIGKSSATMAQQSSPIRPWNAFPTTSDNVQRVAPHHEPHNNLEVRWGQWQREITHLLAYLEQDGVTTGYQSAMVCA